ncbi:hypothetical protein ABIA30_001900 [Mycobacterium sp. MAA66]
MNQATPESSDRPHDVDTGFWLWTAAVPLVVIGFLLNTLTAPLRTTSGYVNAVSVLMMVALTAIAVTFLVLMRQGYRWARSLLTGGGVASVIYLTTSLFVAGRESTAAVGYAVCAIVGSVLIAGGAYLLHRPDSHTYFTR